MSRPGRYTDLGIACPACGNRMSSVLDSRPAKDRIWRRRECHHCLGRFVTYERLATIEDEEQAAAERQAMLRRGSA